MKKTLLLISIFVLVVIIGSVAVVLFENRTVEFKSDEFGFSIKYTAKYVSEISDKILNVRNSINKIKLTVAGTYNSSNLELDKIRENYITTMKIFNDSQEITVLENENIMIGNNEVGKVTFKIKNRENTTKVLSILIPLEDREITVMINGEEETFNKNIKEIENIINSIIIF